MPDRGTSKSKGPGEGSRRETKKGRVTGSKALDLGGCGITRGLDSNDKDPIFDLKRDGEHRQSFE